MTDISENFFGKEMTYTSRFGSDIFIEAYKKTASGFVLVQFTPDKIEHYEKMSDKETAIILPSGGRIEAALPLDDLRDGIANGAFVKNRRFVDLVPFTGKNNKIAEEEALKTPKPGQKMPDGTIYLGQYKPKDRDGNSLSTIFNVFAAPEDLPETMKYVDAVKHIAKLKNWNGYDGTNYATDKELYAAIKSGSYSGGWIIPTRDILQGKDVAGKDTTPDNILSAKDKGAFVDTKHAFKTAAGSGSACPDWYWSSTEHRGLPDTSWVVHFSDGNVVWILKDDIRLSCRPVRLVEASAL